MPSWLVNALIQLAMKVGIPFLVEKFKWIPKEFWEVVQDLLGHVKEQPDRKEAIRNVRKQLECVGIGCVPKTKGK